MADYSAMSTGVGQLNYTFGVVMFEVVKRRGL